MAALNELIEKIENPELRAQIKEAANKLSKQKKFGLVFEEHLPECTPLYELPVKKGSKVSLKFGKVNDTFKVVKIKGDMAWCLPKDNNEAVEYAVDDLVVTAEFGEPIYPYLKKLDSVCNAPDSDLWHMLIEADNYHALQLLEYLYAGKVDCIYIDPPYNTGAKDWKYNNDYVDSSDTYRHSKWLSFMQKRLRLAKKLLNPKNSVLIIAIDEKEYLHLGCLLEEIYSDANIEMVTTIINAKGKQRAGHFAKVEEYLFFIEFGDAKISLERDEKYDTGTEVPWRTLRRGNGPRGCRPNQFYPIFVSNDGKIESIGEPIDDSIEIDNYTAPDGCIAVFPVCDNGKEVIWGITDTTARTLLSKGYLRVGKYNPNKPQKWELSRLTSGKVADIEAGKAQVIGHNKDGSVIAEYQEQKLKAPVSVWNSPTHNAEANGTNLLKSLFRENRFTYPKSIYSVYDALKFVVGENPNALIIDFFAGSGTTLHATNLLNAKDNGRRRCICVTNNEVSQAEQETFINNGFNPGDGEWEKHGIAHYVTWPRTKLTINGVDIDGNPLVGNYGSEIVSYIEVEEEVINNETGKKISGKVYQKEKKAAYPELEHIKMADGFKTNAAFFKLGFLDKNKVALGMQFKEILSTLWMKSGAIGECPEVNGNVPEMLILPKNKMAILNNENCFAEFATQLNEHPEIEVVYLVTDYESSFASMTKALNGKITYQLYRDYLDNFRINAGRNGR